MEVITAIGESAKDGAFKHLTTDFELPKPISTEYYNGTSEESSLFVY